MTTKKKSQIRKKTANQKRDTKVNVASDAVLVDRKTVAYMFGVNVATVSKYTNQDGLPTVAGGQGKANQYDLKAILKWDRSRKGREANEAGLNEEKLKKLHYQARREQLKVEELEGQLIPAADVQSHWETLLIGIKTKLLALPERFKIQLALSDEDRDIVNDEIRQSLEDLSRGDDVPRTESDEE